MEEMLDWSEDLNTEVTKLKNGATIIDCGVKEDGGYEAGLSWQDSAWLTLLTYNIPPLI